MIKHISLPQLAVTAAGTVVSDAPISGELLGCYISSNSGGTITIAATNPATTLMYCAGSASAWYLPMRQASDAGGTAISGVYYPHTLDGYVSAAINSGGTATIMLAVEV